MPFALSGGQRGGLRQALRDERELLRVVLGTLDVALVVCDPGARVTHATRGARSLLGAACATGSGPETWIEHLLPRTPEGLPLAAADLPLARVLRDGSPHELEMLLRTARGELRMKASAHPVPDGCGGGLIGAVVTLEPLSVPPR